MHAQACVKSRQFVEAARDYAELVRLLPDRPAYKLGLAEALRAQGKGKEALAAYREVLAAQPARQDVRLDVVKLLLDDPAAAWYDPQEALKQAREAEKQAQGSDPRVLLALAEALRAGNHPKEALEMVESAYTHYPTDPEVQAARERLRQVLDPKHKPKP